MPVFKTCPGCDRPLRETAVSLEYREDPASTPARQTWACPCGVIVVKTASGTVVTYPPEEMKAEPKPTTLAPPVEQGDRFQKGDEHGPVYVVEKLEKRDGMTEQAVIKQEGSIGSSRGRIRVDSLRYGDGGWRRV